MTYDQLTKKHGIETANEALGAMRYWDGSIGVVRPLLNGSGYAVIVQKGQDARLVKIHKTAAEARQHNINMASA